MHPKLLLLILALTIIFPGSLASSPSSTSLTRVIYDDALTFGWDDWSWTQVNFAVTAPVYSGSKSISIHFDAWKALCIHNNEADALGATHLRFFINGGEVGGQQLNAYLILNINEEDKFGPTVAVPTPAANTWSEIQIPLSTLNPGSNAITGIILQESSGRNQPVLYIDDIAFTNNFSPDAPQLSDSSLFPRSVPADGATRLIVRAKVIDPQGPEDVASVTLDASRLGRGNVVLRDDGLSNDGLANDGIYGTTLTIDLDAAPGEQKLLVTAVDKSGNNNSLLLGALDVLGTPGGAIPASLPQRLGWGTNAWSMTPGQDWQVNSGVPWDYVYWWLTYNWENQYPNSVYNFVHQAWDKQFIPMITVYMIPEISPTCGNTSTCYAEKLQSSSFVEAYLASLQRAAQQAADAHHPVIFNLEPDFYGFLQDLSNDPINRPAGVRPDDPTSFPAALNKNGYPNNLAGFGRFMVDLIHAAAPNALVAPMASDFATHDSPHRVTASEAITMSQRTAAFIDAMGGAQADLLVLEWSDRDAGSGLSPWWDDQDQEKPRPTRAILWANALSSAAHKRLFLWNMPVGNMMMNNTCDHYQDNRAAYVFSHPRDLIDAGVVGVLFSGGTDCMTQVWTDGGFVAAQGGIYYSTPAVPSGLTANNSVGSILFLRWNESSEPDLWGYMVVYQLAAGGPQYIVDAGRRNSIALVLWANADWEIRIQAYDAMGNASPLSSPVRVKMNNTTNQTFLPLLNH